MIAKRVPWTAVETWMQVLGPDGVATVLPSYVGDQFVALLHGNGRTGMYQRPGGYATVLEPEIGDAVGNLMQHFTLEQIEDTG